MKPEDRLELVQSIGELVVHVVNDILEIQAERDRTNKATDDLPPVLPHQLVKVRGKEFVNILSNHRKHLEQFWDEITIDKIERQHNKLLLAYTTESTLKHAIDKCDQNTSFMTGWAIVEGRFNVLKDFCGGIATVFANTASVEADFSLLSWEKDEYRMSLTDLSLEGIMQCKQFEVLSSLV